MKRLILTLFLAALVAPGVALGTGPSAASVDGPGSGGGLTITGGEGDGSALSNLTMEGGFFAGAFGQQPSPMLPARPTGDLGPRYTVTYTVPDGDGTPSVLKQDVYPYAKPLPVTYMAPGQPIFSGETTGGWFPATSGLKDVLVAAGLPATRPTAGSDGRSFPSFAIPLVAAVLLLAAVAVIARRRLRPAARMAGSPS
jgi:hypothetical protein